MTDPQQPYSPYGESDPQGRGASDPYGQSGYGAAPHPGTTQPYGQPYPGNADHPQGTLILIFGIAGFFVGVLGPVAWIMGSRALKDIRATGAHPANEQLIVIGRILGIIVTVLMILGFILGLILVFGAAIAANSAN